MPSPLGTIPTQPLDELQADFDIWLQKDNMEHPHLGYRNMSRCPIEAIKQFSKSSDLEG